MKADEAAAAALELAALSLAALFTFRYVSRMADPRRSERSSALAKGRAALASRLLEGRARALVLEEHELEVAGDVVCPDEICVSFDDVGGLDNLARQLQHAILLPLKRPDLFAQTRLLRPPKGILLHGPPGTGKTMLARAIAKEARFTFINLNPARLLSKWYGESNKFAEAYFTLAEKLAPSIIFIDEIDCLFASGRSGEHEATSTLRAQFLMLWDGLLSPTAQASPVVVLAATNRADSVDPAVLRRLPLSFRVDLPNQRAREAVLRLVLRDEPLAAEVDLCALAAATDGYSGSDLEQLCKTAMMTPLEEYLQKEEIERLAASESCSNCDGVGTVDDNHRDVCDNYDSSQRKIGLRCLSLADFLQARALVPPTRGRFEPMSHGLQGQAIPSDQDMDLYD